MSSSAAASMTDELEATRQKKRRKKHRERAEVAAASSESPRPPATPYSMLESPAPTAPETLTSTAVAAASPLVEEAVRKEERKKHKRSRYQEEAATPSPSAPATAAQILEMAAARKEQRRGKVEQGQSCQALLPVDVHPQGGGAAAAAYAGVSVSQSAKRCRGGKIPVLSDREILRIRRIELRKQQPMPESFVPAMANPNPIDQDSKYSSPFGAFFDQFCYKPDCQEGRNATSLPKTPDRPARPLPRDHLPSLSSQLTANETFMAAKTTTSNTKQPRSASVSHPQEEAAAAADAGVSVSQSVKRCRGGKIPVLSDHEILRTRRIELRKQQPMPESFVPAMANPNPIDQDSKYSSPFGAFFDQFRYKPDRQEGRNATSLPKTPDRPARPLPRDHPPSLSSQLTANETFMAAKKTKSNTKQPRSASVSHPQEEVKLNEKKWSEKIISQMKKLRKKSPLLSAAEKRSNKYRRLPLNQLVCPPRSRYNLLQEKYASDPWKVIVICMLLNLTKGDQVKRKLEGFFERYPDARTAYTADPEKMAKYLAPLGLQRVKANRIQRFSRAYVEEEWTYITELCGVGKYAADAYAIFCAGRATEVVPEDHKLVVYWKFVCKLSLTQASQNEQEAAGATRL